MRNFTQILESKNSIKYIINVVFEEDHMSFFSFASSKGEEGTKMLKAANSNITEIVNHPIDTEIGKTIFLTISYDIYNDVVVKGYKTPFEAIAQALNVYEENVNNETPYYGIKVFKWKITTDNIKLINSLDEFDKENYILYANYAHEETNDIFIVPEYVNNPKVKNLLLSIKSVNKFKL